MRMRRRSRPVGGALVGALVALAVTATACTAHRADGSGGAAGSSPIASVTRTTIVGTSTVTSTTQVTDQTFTVPVSPSTGGGTPSSGAGRPVSTAAVSSTGLSGTGRSDGTGSPASTVGSSTALPAARIGECPYLSAEDVKDINGQHHGPTSIIPVKPYPICIFTRSDGGYLATTRIVVAASPAAATAAVNAVVPVDVSFPVSDPPGWSGGAMALPKTDAVGNNSIYAVAKGKIAIIAESNQAQSIKGRQMVEQIVKNLGW